MLISIITVSFNSERTIARTIKSVLDQDCTSFEYIIVDGLSNDNTVSIAKSFENSFKEKNIDYKIISEKDNGIYDAMNKGIKMARGEVIGLINSDDYYEKNTISSVVEAYGKKKFDLFYGCLRLIRQNGKTLIKKAKLKKYVSSRHWNHPTSFISSKTYKKYNYYSLTNIYDDFDLYLKIRKDSDNVIYISDKILANFTSGGISTKRNIKDTIKRCKYKYACYKNNGYCFLYWFECVAMEFAKLIFS